MKYFKKGFATVKHALGSSIHNGRDNLIKGVSIAEDAYSGVSHALNSYLNPTRRNLLSTLDPYRKLLEKIVVSGIYRESMTTFNKWVLKNFDIEEFNLWNNHPHEVDEFIQFLLQNDYGRDSINVLLIKFNEQYGH